MTDSSEKYFIGETFVNIKTQNELFEQIKLSLARKEKKIFFYLNSYSFYLVHHNQEFKAAFNNADFILIDGMSIVYLLRRYKYQKVQKVTLNHTFYNLLLQYFVREKKTVYLLGSSKENLEKAKTNLTELGLLISGTHDGYFEENETNKIIEEINSVKPDILFVGMGMPKSEFWQINNKENFGNYLSISVGNLIDIFAEETKIAPKFLFNTPFEWLYRLLHEPRKLFVRYLKANLFILYYLLKFKWSS